MQANNPATINLSIDQATALAEQALLAHGASARHACILAKAVVQAECEGNRVCGLYYVVNFCDQLDCGKLKGNVEPTLISTHQASRIVVDANHGFAHTAFILAVPNLIEAAQENGCATLSIKHSYNCLAVGHFVSQLAESGLVAIGCSNSPACVAPPGGRSALYGTNPFAFAVPGPEGVKILVDQSTSATTKTEILLRSQSGESLEPSWAVDSEGLPTTDAQSAVNGYLCPNGGYKGANISLLVEILAAALTSSTLSKDASLFSGKVGGPPDVGQFFIAIDPSGSEEFKLRIIDLCHEIVKIGGHIPGSTLMCQRKKAAQNGIDVSIDLVTKIKELAGSCL